MSATETMTHVPLSVFKDFEVNDTGTSATRAKRVTQSFRVVPRVDGTLLVEVVDGDSTAALVVSADDARRFGDMLHAGSNPSTNVKPITVEDVDANLEALKASLQASEGGKDRPRTT